MKRFLTTTFLNSRAAIGIALLLVALIAPEHAHAAGAISIGCWALTAMNASAVRVIDPVLTTVAQGYTAPNLIGRRILAAVPVNISGGQILQFGKEAFMKYNLRRAPGGNKKRIQFGYLGQHYALVQDALEVAVPDEWQRDASVMPGVDLGSRAVKLGMQVTEMSLENDIAALVLNTSNVPNNTALSGSAKWSNDASNPITDVQGFRETVRTAIGAYPNLATFSAVAWKAFKNNANVKDRFKFTSDKSITTQMIAELLEVEEVQIGTAVSSDDSGTFSDIWGNNFLLSYSPKNPAGPEQPAFGYTYTMQGNPLVQTPYHDPSADAWVYPAKYERSPVIAGSAGAYLVQNPN